ncbi:unnamed protein product [Paramecium sonneborni]|uniref:Oxidoreductase-like domain-containing protein n=1 Tax=Paramecium sonneborni TaxID=65129 RepID=A0A8S1R3B5_9CILI|nr:unnamed protein product [Paramecium sonneborni]
MLLIYIRKITMNLWSQIASQFKQNIKLFDRIDESDLCKEQSFEINYQMRNLKQKKERPIEPDQPDPDECCGSGCQRCVLDVYYEKLEQYEKDLMEWLQEQDENDDRNESS